MVKKTTQKPKRKNKRTELTDKQKEFCFNYVYVYLGDHSESYTKAGYSATSPYEISRRSKKLLEEEHIQKHIKELEEAKAGSKLVDRHYVIKNLVAKVEDKTEQSTIHVACLKLLAQSLNMLTEKTIEKTVDSTHDHATEAQKARMERKKLKERGDILKNANNVIDIQEGANG